MVVEKGLVVETGDGWVILLLPNGEFKEIRNKGFLQVGDVYRFGIHYLLKYAVAAVLFMAILLGTVDFLSVTAYARLSPGVELGLNRWDRVVSVKSTDQEGQEMMQELEVRGKKVDEALDIILKQSLNPSRAPAGNVKEITVLVEVKEGKDEKYQERLTEKIDKAVQKTVEKENMSRFNENGLKVDQVIVKTVNKQIKANSTDQKKPDNSKSGRGDSDNNKENNKSDNNGKNPKNYIPGDKQIDKGNLQHKNDPNEDKNNVKNKKEEDKEKNENDIKKPVPNRKEKKNQD